MIYKMRHSHVTRPRSLRQSAALAGRHLNPERGNVKASFGGREAGEESLALRVSRFAREAGWEEVLHFSSDVRKLNVVKFARCVTSRVLRFPTMHRRPKRRVAVGTAEKAALLAGSAEGSRRTTRQPNNL